MNKIIDWPARPEYSKEALEDMREYFKGYHNRMLRNIRVYLRGKYPDRAYEVKPGFCHLSDTGEIGRYRLYRGKRKLADFNLMFIPDMESEKTEYGLYRRKCIVDIWTKPRYGRFIRNLAKSLEKRKNIAFIMIHKTML